MLVALAASFPLAAGETLAGGQASDHGGAIAGAVVNGTPGFPAPDGIEVTLRYRDDDGVPQELRTLAVLGSEGAGATFQFPGVSSGERPYVLEVTYRGVVYTLDGPGPPNTLPNEEDRLTVYETGSDLDALRVLDDTLAVTAFDRRRRQMAVLESVRLENRGDRTFVADPASVGPMGLLRFSLPPRTGDLEIGTPLVGGHLIQVDRGVALTMPIPPGVHELLLIYRTAYDGSTMDYRPHFPLGADTYRVMLPSGLVQVEAPGMAPAGPVTLGPREYQVFESHDLAPDAFLDLRLTGLPQPTLTERLSDVVESDGVRRGALPVLAATLMAGLLAYAVMRRRRPAALATAPAPDDGGEDGFDGLVTAIARLDEGHASGVVSNEAYEAERSALMDRLRSLREGSAASGGGPPAGER